MNLLYKATSHAKMYKNKLNNIFSTTFVFLLHYAEAKFYISFFKEITTRLNTTKYSY